MEIISREEARAQGLNRYFTNKPCKHGHYSERYVGSQACVECSLIASKKSYDPKRKPVIKGSIPRKVAIERGLKNYFTGRPCGKGHIAERRVSDRSCISCRREQYDKNYEKFKRYRREYYEENKEYLAKMTREYYENNVDRHNARARERYKKPEVKLAVFIRESLRRTLYNKTKSSFETVGYGPKELRNHIESLFEDGMSWENYGEWHIDHIIPVSYLIEKGERDPSVINALDNLRPLWASENLSKGAKYNPEES